MRSFTQKVCGAALTGALVLSGVPSALALSLNTDANSLLNIHRNDAFVQSNTSASASADMQASARCKSYSGDELARCEAIIKERAEVNGEAKADADTHGNFVSTTREEARESKATVAAAESRVLAVIKRVLNNGARLIRHLCSADNADETVVKQCVATAKSHVQAQISLMIDVAFGVN